MVQEKVVRSPLSPGTRATFSERMANQRCIDAVLGTGALHQDAVIINDEAVIESSTRCYFLDGRCPALRLGFHKRREGFGRVTQRLETEVRDFGLHVP